MLYGYSVSIFQYLMSYYSPDGAIRYPFAMLSGYPWDIKRRNIWRDDCLLMLRRKFPYFYDQFKGVAQVRINAKLPLQRDIKANFKGLFKELDSYKTAMRRNFGRNVVGNFDRKRKEVTLTLIELGKDVCLIDISK